MRKAAGGSSQSAPGVSVVLAEVVRSGFVEGRHRGSVVALSPTHEVLWSAGDVTAPIFPRSCNKPLQAAAMVRLGLRLSAPLLALVSSSHSGETMHVNGVLQILRDVGLDEAALRTPAGWPLDDDVREAVVRDWGNKSPLLMNCSGKHAGMLATCVANRWPTGTYLELDHPLQRAIAAIYAELTGEPVAAVGVDGCGAPLLSSSLVGLATAFSRLALAGADSAEGAVAAAIRAHPRLVSGSDRDEAALLTALPGAIGKAGAEASYAVALADGTAVALKIDDGADRARSVAMAAALRRLGGSHPVLDEQSSLPLFGGARPVGEVRAVAF